MPCLEYKQIYSACFEVYWKKFGIQVCQLHKDHIDSVSALSGNYTWVNPTALYPQELEAIIAHVDGPQLLALTLQELEAIIAHVDGPQLLALTSIYGIVPSVASIYLSI